MSEAIVKSERLYIRYLELNDLDRTWEWMHRKDINDKIGVKIPFTMDDQLKWFKDLQTNNAKYVFAVCKIKDDVHIGNVSVDTINQRHKNARFSIFIADLSNRGMGFGTEALSLVEKFSFEKLAMHKIWCKTDASDSQLLNFYEASGYKKEGILFEHELRDGEFIDKAIFSKINID